VLWSDHLGGIRTTKDGIRRNSNLVWMDVYVKK